MNKLDFKGEYSGKSQYDIVPRAVVVINNTATIPLSYQLTTNAYLESDSLSINLPMELVDIKELLQVARSQSDFVTIELYSGFINSQSPQHVFTQGVVGGKSNDQLKKDFINKKIYKDVLPLRWFGVLDKAPTLFWGSKDQSDMITLTCGEIFNKLAQIMYEKKYEGDKASISNVIKDLQAFLKKIKIEIDPKVKQDQLNQLMGSKIKYAKDNEDGSEGSEEKEDKEYSTSGKNVLEIIKEICTRGKLDFVQSDVDPFTYIFQPIYTPSKLWTLDRSQHFSSLKIEGGDGSTSSGGGKISLKMKSKQKDGTILEYIYPEKLQNDSPETLNLKVINTAPNLTKPQLEQLALDYFLNYNKSLMYGTITIDNALTMLKPHHAIKIVDNSTVPQLRKIKLVDSNNKPLEFKIISINESYNKDSGLKQESVEFILNDSSYFINVKDGSINSILNGVELNKIDGLESNKGMTVKKLDLIKNSSRTTMYKE